MAMTRHTCKKCSSIVERDPEEDGQGVDHEPGLESFVYDGPMPDGWDDVVSDSFEAELERRFSRPEHAMGRQTLGDLLIEYVGLELNAVDEVIDPEVLEVFPNLYGGMARPAGHPLRRSHDALMTIMVRVGRPIAVILEYPLIEKFGDGPFAIASPLQDGEHTCCGLGNHLALVDEFPDCLNAHDYAPDGSPLVSS